MTISDIVKAPPGTVDPMAHITIDIDEELLRTALELFKNPSASEVINEALQIAVARREQTLEFLAVLKKLDFSEAGRGGGWRYGAGRDWAGQDAMSNGPEEDDA